MPVSPRQIAELDSTTLRVLAHPLRMRLLAALRIEGPATATTLARRLGTNSGKTSYHLRRLAAVGLVVDDPERSNARDRGWRAAHTGSSWSSTRFRDDPDDRAADDWMAGNVARQHTRWLEEWLAGRGEWPAEWLAASDVSDYSMRLTAERLDAMNRELHGVIRRYWDSEEPPDNDAAERVTVVMHCFPNPEPSL